jgi:hypothetical protein
MQITGTKVEKYPKARPNVTLDAGPALQLAASSLTGAYVCEVTY